MQIKMHVIQLIVRNRKQANSGAWQPAKYKAQKTNAINVLGIYVYFLILDWYNF